MYTFFTDYESFRPCDHSRSLAWRHEAPEPCPEWKHDVLLHVVVATTNGMERHWRGIVLRDRLPAVRYAVATYGQTDDALAWLVQDVPAWVWGHAIDGSGALGQVLEAFLPEVDARKWRHEWNWPKTIERRRARAWEVLFQTLRLPHCTAAVPDPDVICTLQSHIDTLIPRATEPSAHDVFAR